MSSTNNDDGWICSDLEVVNRRGLHARASAKFVQVCEQFSADITVEKDGTTVGGQSIMGLMLLAASKGSTVRICAKGLDANDALNAIQQLMAERFGEEA
ncbi:MAG: HPr family phosphocarrier protein [Pseudomonadota bacterium]